VPVNSSSESSVTKFALAISPCAARGSVALANQRFGCSRARGLLELRVDRSAGDPPCEHRAVRRALAVEGQLSGTESCDLWCGNGS
jgi:hypothetical protein